MEIKQFPGRNCVDRTSSMEFNLVSNPISPGEIDKRTIKVVQMCSVIVIAPQSLTVPTSLWPMKKLLVSGVSAKECFGGSSDEGNKTALCVIS